MDKNEFEMLQEKLQDAKDLLRLAHVYVSTDRVLWEAIDGFVGNHELKCKYIKKWTIKEKVKEPS